jgi:tRNA-splicing ligase RtcB
MVHSGSRALGPAVLAHHGAAGDDVGRGLLALPADSDRGRAYLHDAAVAREYAVSNRRAIGEAAGVALAGALGVEVDWRTWFDCVHNFVRGEEHGGEAL